MTSQIKEQPAWVTYGYYGLTGLFCLMLLASGTMQFIQPPDLIATMDHLGYPHYFMYILGTAKILGVLAIVYPELKMLPQFPFLPVLKEWAYAGFTVNLLSAFFSHLAVGDGLAGSFAPIVPLLFMVGSYALYRKRLGSW